MLLMEQPQLISIVLVRCRSMLKIVLAFIIYSNREAEPTVGLPNDGIDFAAGRFACLTQTMVSDVRWVVCSITFV